MGIFSAIANFFRAPSRRQVVRASFDSTKSTPENYRHWSNIDYDSADASMSTDVRRKIRAQARYECQENNSYGKGIAITYCEDVVGKGPRLQLTHPTLTKDQAQEIESKFDRWGRASKMRDKLLTFRMAQMVDGEAVARIITNMQIGDPITLDWQLIESDQLGSPFLDTFIKPDYVDGIHLDRYGNPRAYDILKHHPGANYWSAQSLEFDTYSADQIIHSFRQDRPGQHHGVSEFAASLPLFAFLRRFTLATVSAAETAANVSQVIETDAPIPDELVEEYSSTTFDKFLDTIPIDRNSATVLPNQWKLKQFAPEHPTTTYGMFKQEILAEIARVVGMPRNIAALDSKDMNYSSTKVDQLAYHRKIRLDQTRLGCTVCSRLFAEWLIEAALVGELPEDFADFIVETNITYGRAGLMAAVEHVWGWDGFEDADANKAANAQRTKLSNGTTHRAMEYDLQGLDIEVEDSRAAVSFGMTVERYRELCAMSIFSNGNLLNQEPQRQPNEKQTSDGTTQTQAGFSSTFYS